MTRPAVTVVIPVWNQWSFTRRCLDSLRPTLGPRDQVVIVDNGSADGTGAALVRYPWVKVISNPTNLGFAAACNQGGAWRPERGAAADIIVFLNNDTILDRGWLDALVAPFDDPAVGATGPRSNSVSGAQLVTGAGYDPRTMRGFREFAKQWARDNRDRTTDVRRLVGFALAVRRAAFDEVGAFDESFGIGGCEDDDLCDRLVAAGYRLLIAHGSFVHHHGHATFDGNGLDWYSIQQDNANRYLSQPKRGPSSAFLSACLIVKDEEEVLGDCLASITDAVDEIVVYDTGSTDRTVEIARAAGAVVLDGYWDDDFARARNASLAACTGEWILHIDADETLLADPEQLRVQLRAATAYDALVVPIDNLVGDGEGAMQSHTGARLFRRNRAQWQGRLHEQIVPLPGQAALRPGEVTRTRILHAGYTEAALYARDKTARNLRVAELEAQEHPSAIAEIQLGRCLSAVGRVEDALEHYKRARSMATGSGERVSAAQYTIDCLFLLGRYDEAETWVEQLRRATRNKSYATLYRARLLRERGRYADALALLEPLTEVSDDSGSQAPPATLTVERMELLELLGHRAEAVDLGLRSIRCGEGLYQLPTFIAFWRKILRPLDDLVAAFPPSASSTIRRTLVRLDPDGAAELAEAVWQRGIGAADVLAAMIRIAAHLDTTAALEWSARLRARGAGDHCPLVARADMGSLPRSERILAAATAARAFEDRRAFQLGRKLLAEADDRTGQLADELAVLCPELLGGGDRPASRPTNRSTPRLPRATLVIAADHHHQETWRCLRRVSMHTPAELYDVVIVHDGGDRPTAELLSGVGGDVRILTTDGPLSRAAALALGAARAEAGVTVLLDNHSHPFRPWLQPLLRELSDPDVVAAGSRFINYTGTLRHTGFRLGQDADGALSVLTLFQGQPAALELANVATPLQAVGEGCLAVRSDELAAAGGLDGQFGERLFDVDLCLRLAGPRRRVMYQPQSCLLRGDRRPLPHPTPEQDTDLARLQELWQGRVSPDLVEGPTGWSTPEATGTGADGPGTQTPAVVGADGVPVAR